MAKQCSTNFPRAISVADYILEGNGHSVAEASKEFHLGKTTIERDINLLGSVAFYGLEPNVKELQSMYLEVKKTLRRLAKEHNANNIGKWNTQKATF